MVGKHIAFSTLLALCVLFFSTSQGCAPDLSEGDGGLRFCSNTEDCTKQLGKNYECLMHLCQKKQTSCLGTGRPCEVKGEKGPCKKGITKCTNGQLFCEKTYTAAQTETCGNGIDDDCNGQIDDPLACKCQAGTTKECYPNGTAGCTFSKINKTYSCTQPCVAGRQVCGTNSTWGACQAYIVPDKEICDGKDNDCNGKIDENFPNKGAPCGVLGKLGPCATGKYVCDSAKGYPTCQQTIKAAPKDSCANNIDDDCDGQINNGCKCTQGQTIKCYNGKKGTETNAPCKRGTATCGEDGKYGNCIGEITPKTEVCDGKDNDCDGKTDETFASQGVSCTDPTRKGPCQKGIRACVNAKVICKQTIRATKEICDGIDNDCDGKTDENCPCIKGQSRSCGTNIGECKKGKQTCDEKGIWGPCVGEVTVKKELCDGKDNDCDGKVDNNFKIGQPCSVGVGACQQTGSYVCDPTKTKSICNAKAKKPKPEECDGKDNDCDGKIDEQLSRACYTGPTGTKNKGICKDGKQTCSNKQWGACKGEVLPAKEIPGNNIDEDCNGSDLPLDKGCLDKKEEQVWTAGKMVACDCKTSPCSAQTASSLCAKGWRICNVTDWKKHYNKKASNKIRYIAATLTGCSDKTVCFCHNGVSGIRCGSGSVKLIDAPALCTKSSCTYNSKPMYWNFFVGPLSLNLDLKVCQRFQKTWINKVEGILGRGDETTTTIKSQSASACLQNKKPFEEFKNSTLIPQGVMCCK